jgi:hypothetical protein
MKSKWRDQSWSNHQRFIARGNKKNRLTDETEVINFLALALCGEAGELANLIKKMGKETRTQQVSVLLGTPFPRPSKARTYANGSI